MTLAYDDDDPTCEEFNQTIREDLIERSKVFTTYYTEKCEEKLKAYQKELEPREKKKATEKFNQFCENAPIPGNLKNPIKNVEEAIASNNTIRNELIYEFIEYFIRLEIYERRILFVDAGGYIFWSYQNQFKYVTDIHDNVTVGMQKLAIDAVDRMFDFIENCEQPENLGLCSINIAINTFFGASKTFKGLKKGETIKFKGRECQTASLYEGVSIIKKQVDGTYVQYITSKSNHRKYGYRLASSEEAYNLSEYRHSNFTLNSPVNEILTEIDMKPHLAEILNKINNKDNTDELIKDTTVIKQNFEKIKENTSIIKQNFEKIKENTSVIKQFFKYKKENTSNIGDNKTDTTINKLKLDIVQENMVDNFHSQMVMNVEKKYNILATTYNRYLLNKISNISKKLKHIKYIFLLLVIFIVGYTRFSNPDPIQKDLKKSIWFDTREPVKYFTGRLEILKRLHNALQKNKKKQVALSQTTVIAGLGGIGKTELARKYIYDYKTNYYNVLWIKSETQEIFKESFHKVAIKLNVSIKEGIKIVERERDLTSIIKDVYLYFNNTKTLIIFDNVDKLDDIKQFLDVSLPPNIAKPFILITSRNQEWDVGEEGTIEIIKLNEFTQEESHDVIRKSLLDVNSTNEEVNELSNELQNFPLALNQATSYINMMKKKLKLQGKQTFGINDYLSLYKAKLLKFKPSVGYERYFDTVYTTWIVTLQKIKENNDALNIIQFMAYLKPDLDVDLCFSNYFENKDDMWRAIRLLHQYSMIDIVNGRANIHRLVQEVIRIKLIFEKKQEEVLSKALDIFSPSENVSIDKELSLHLPLRSIHKNDEHNIFQYYFKYKYGKGKHIPFNLLECGNLKTLYYAITFQEIQEMKDIVDEDVQCRNVLIFTVGQIYCSVNIALIFYVVKSGMLKSQYYILYLVIMVVFLISLFFFTFLLYSLILQYENLCSLISFVPKLL